MGVMGARPRGSEWGARPALAERVDEHAVGSDGHQSGGLTSRPTARRGPSPPGRRRGTTGPRGTPAPGRACDAAVEGKSAHTVHVEVSLPLRACRSSPQDSPPRGHLMPAAGWLHSLVSALAVSYWRAARLTAVATVPRNGSTGRSVEPARERVTTTFPKITLTVTTGVAPAPTTRVHVRGPDAPCSGGRLGARIPSDTILCRHGSNSVRVDRPCRERPTRRCVWIPIGRWLQVVRLDLPKSPTRGRRPAGSSPDIRRTASPGCGADWWGSA